jgi:uncharacterized membrane protein
MRKFFLFFLALPLFFLQDSTVFAQNQTAYQESYVKAEVVKIVSDKTIHISGSEIREQTFQVKLLEGEEKGASVDITRSGSANIARHEFRAGEQVIVNRRHDARGALSYSLYEPYRLDLFWFVLFGFVILIVFVGGKKGVGAFLGLVISLVLISQWIVPNMIRGDDPVQIVIIGSTIMLFVTTYIAHGFSLKTTVALVSTAVALAFTGWLSEFLVDIMALSGLGNEEIYQLQLGSGRQINTQGLLLGAIIIGTLGALNDMTTTQAITIFTLVKENPKQKFHDLFRKGMEIGKEHIASLVNTLVLAYTGSSLGIFILISVNPANLPWWVILNNETMLEEIIATIAGSSALILAVPLTTLLAAAAALRGTTFREFFKHP